MKTVKVQAADILTIGYKAFEKEGNTHFLTVFETVATDRIILRSILECFGETYKILDVVENDESDDAEIISNLPWEKYEEIEKSNN